MNEIIIKPANKDIEKELNLIEFDSAYLNIAKNKYHGNTYKIFNLKPHEATILKQTCLSLGFDCAVSRKTLMRDCEYTNCIIFSTQTQIEELIKKLRIQPFRLKQVADILKTIVSSKLQPINIRNYNFDWTRPYIMGIINTTPDSFSDGGKYIETKTALEHAIKLINDGADILDIGGESTRPNADYVEPENEIKRVIPVIEAIRKENINIPISIDTRNYITAKAAIEAGADIINDVTGFDYDENLLKYACENNIISIIMHSNKVPAESNNFCDEDIIEQIYFSLNSKIQKLTEMGLNKSHIIADTGIGFGKSQEGCFEILKRHNEFKTLDVALLLGISRKSFIRNSFNINYDEADIVTALYSSMVKNVNIHRVHNVELVKKYIDYSSKIS